MADMKKIRNVITTFPKQCLLITMQTVANVTDRNSLTPQNQTAMRLSIPRFSTVVDVESRPYTEPDVVDTGISTP